MGRVAGGTPTRPPRVKPEDDEPTETQKAQTVALSAFSSNLNVNSFFDVVALCLFLPGLPNIHGLRYYLRNFSGGHLSI